jgi:hypothetical protein
MEFKEIFVLKEIFPWREYFWWWMIGATLLGCLF